MTWYLEIAMRRWSTEEYECAQGLMVSYLRDFFVESQGWHHGFGDSVRVGGGPNFQVPRDTKLVVSQCHRTDGSKFSLHIVCPALVFDCTTLGMKSFAVDFAVYVVYRLFKELKSMCFTMLDVAADVLKPLDRAVLRLLQLHKHSVDSRFPSIGTVSPIDLCVYKVQGQLYRLVGMGKVSRGILGEPLCICGGDGSSPRNLVANHGVGDLPTWLESVVSFKRPLDPMGFFVPPCSWRGWFYQSEDIAWQRQRRKVDVAAGIVPDDADAVQRVEDVPLPRVYESGPRPDFVFEQLLHVGGARLVQSLLGLAVAPPNTNRKGKGKPRGWRPEGPGFSHSPKVGTN